MVTFDWSFARLTVPVAVTVSMMVSSRWRRHGEIGSVERRLWLVTGADGRTPA